MIFTDANDVYTSINYVFHGTVNDVYICKKESAPGHELYVLNAIYDRKMIKRILELFQKEDSERQNIYCFTSQDYLCLVFEYHHLRALDQFYMPNMRNIQECESIFTNLVWECMTAELPYDILYLIIKQKLFNLTETNEITFNYAIDFADYRENVTEYDCLHSLVYLILGYYYQKEEYNTASYQVIHKKDRRDAYHSFLELYQDLNHSKVLLEKESFLKKLKRKLLENQDSIYRIFRVIAISVGVLALIAIIMRFLWGDSYLTQLMVNTFRTIGERDLTVH